MKKVILIIIMSIFALSVSYSKNTSKSDSSDNQKNKSAFYLNSGLSGGFPMSMNGVLSLNVIYNKFTLSVRISQIEEDEGDKFFSPLEYRVADFGGLIGYSHRPSQNVLITGAIGMSATETKVISKEIEGGGSWFGFGSDKRYEYRTVRGLGFPVEMQFMYHNSFIGIGVTLYGNINSEKTVVAPALSVQIGNFDL